MAVAGTVPTAWQLTNRGKMQSARCRLCRLAREARGESTDGLAVETEEGPKGFSVIHPSP